LITASESKLEYDYAGLIITRKMKDNKAFSFNLPLNILPSLMDALESIKKVNPKFFGPEKKFERIDNTKVFYKSLF